MRFGELTRRGLGAGERGQQRDALVRRRRVAEQPQGGREPPRRSGRRARRGFLAGFAQDRDGVGVAAAGGALEMVRPRCRRRAARGECVDAASMGAEAPASGRGLVHRPADERVAEAEAARDVGGANEVAAQELVERVDGRRLVDVRRGRHQLGLERVAGDRRSFEAPAGRGGEQRQLLGEGRGDRRRHLDVPDRRRRGSGRAEPRPVERARELLEVEGIAAALLVERGRVDAAAEQLARLLQRQRLELEPREASGAVRALEGGRQALRALPRTDRHREEHGRRRRAAQQGAEQLDRAGVGPVQVVEDQHQRLGRSEQLEQLAHRAVGAVPLVLQRRPAAVVERAEARKDVRELRASLAVQTLEPPRVEPFGVLVERVDEDPERQIALELRRGAGEHQVAAPVGARGELGEQARLADARLPDELDRAGEALLEIRQDLVEHVELRGTPDEFLRRGDHVASS